MAHPDIVVLSLPGYGDDVHRFLLTPRWVVLHLTLAAAAALCVVLGWWQLGVYEESQNRQDVRDREPVPISELVEPGEPIGEARDRQVVARGRYLPDRQLIVPGRIHEGILGSFVLTPLQTAEGMIVPVLRGWVEQPDDPATAVPEGTVSVTGFLLRPETSAHATVRSDQPLADGHVGYIAPDRLAERGGLPETDSVEGYVLLTGQEPEAAPSPAELKIGVIAPIRDVSPWQNLSYWAQWWVFALAAVVFWVSVVRSAVRSRRSEVSEPARSRVLS